MEPDEAEILKTAKDLSQKVGLSKRYDPQTIAWSANVSWDSCQFSPGVRRRTGLILPLGLRTKLEPAEWRSLLAYSLIQRRSQTRNFVVPFFIFVISEAAFFLAYGFIGLAFGTIPYLSLGIIPVFLLGLVVGLRYTRYSLFRNLREAADIGGRQALLDVLGKIDSMGIVEVEKGKRRKGLIGSLWPIPSITDRIEYLRKFG